MEEIIYGAVGMLGALALLGLGVALGWHGQRWWQRQRVRHAAHDTAQRQQDDERAFSLLMGYNADLAYGVTAAGDLLPVQDEEGNDYPSDLASLGHLP